MTTALINNIATEFIQANQGPAPNGPAVITLTAPIGLSLDDVTAVLYDLGDGMSADELADDDYARHLVADLVFNAGLLEVDALRHQMSEIRIGHPGYGWLTYARRRAAELFPAAVPGPARTTRRLATVGGAR